MILPIFMVPSTHILISGTEAIGSLIGSLVGDASLSLNAINTSPFIPAMNYEGIESSLIEKDGKIFGRIVNNSNETLLLTKQFLFGYIPIYPSYYWKYVTYKMVIDVDEENDDFNISGMTFHNYDEALNIFAESDKMSIGENRRINSIHQEGRIVINYINRVS